MAINLKLRLNSEEEFKLTFSEVDSAFTIRLQILNDTAGYNEQIKKILNSHFLVIDENNEIVLTYDEVRKLMNSLFLEFSINNQIQSTDFQYTHEGIISISSFEEKRSNLFINELKDVVNDEKYNSYKEFEKLFPSIIEKVSVATITTELASTSSVIVPAQANDNNTNDNNTNVNFQTFAKEEDEAIKSDHESPLIPKHKEHKNEQSSSLVDQVKPAAEKSAIPSAESQSQPQIIIQENIVPDEDNALQKINRIKDDIYLGRHKTPFVGITVMNKKGRMESYTTTTYKIFTLIKQNEKLPPQIQKKSTELLQTIQDMLAPKLKQRGYACYDNWLNIDRHAEYSKYLDGLLKDIATTSWKIKAFPFGGTVTTIRYKSEDGLYHKVKKTVPEHIARVCNIINHVGDKYTSEQATAKVLAIFQRAAEHSHSDRLASTQAKYKAYAEMPIQEFPIINEQLEYKKILDWLKQDIALTNWQNFIKYKFWGGGDAVAFNYYNTDKEAVKTFDGLVPHHIAQALKIIDQVGEKYSHKEAVLELNKLFSKQYTDNYKKHSKGVGRTEFTQIKYNTYTEQLKYRIDKIGTNTVTTAENHNQIDYDLNNNISIAPVVVKA